MSEKTPTIQLFGSKSLFRAYFFSNVMDQDYDTYFSIEFGKVNACSINIYFSITINKYMSFCLCYSESNIFFEEKAKNNNNNHKKLTIFNA